MVEWEELQPGTVWRDLDGEQQVVKERASAWVLTRMVEDATPRLWEFADTHWREWTRVVPDRDRLADAPSVDAVLATVADQAERLASGQDAGLPFNRGVRRGYRALAAECREGTP
jgi:hypothetical protein